MSSRRGRGGRSPSVAEPGSAEYAVLLDRHGRLPLLRLLRSSGTDILDKAGVAAIERSETLSEAVKAAAWKARVRLCARYRRLQRAGKPTAVISRP